MRFTLLFLIGGAVLFWYGCQEFSVSRGTSSDPVAMELSVLEGGSPPKNNHLMIGAHVAVYYECIYEYEADEFDTGDPEPTAKVNHAYYPVISEAHPYVKALDALEEKHGGLDKIPLWHFATNCPNPSLASVSSNIKLLFPISVFS